MKKFLPQNLFPSDITPLSFSELNELAQEVREELISVVSKFGGHIGPNLGVVELTIALLKSFNPPTDKIVWDVGHQTYVYKMLTGRYESFRTSLRNADGCCGFTNRDESEYDSFGSGHAGNAISAALGMAVGRDLLNLDEKLIAIVGDGSLGCGISLEALNNIAGVTKNFIVIINDNEMSIDANVGALSKHLDQIIGESENEHLARGTRVGRSFTSNKDRLSHQPKRSFFENLGVKYIGPIDGHDIEKMVETFEQASQLDCPVVIHLLTEKGLGYEPAKRDPELFHGLGSFDPVTGKPLQKSPKVASYSTVFGNQVEKLGHQNDKIVAITAGMCLGTGLYKFKSSFPDRFFDVGIAEEHAVIFAAGLATKGIRPIVALYATFSQRAFDCVYHDVCLQNLPVIFALDRAGFVSDGPTHHGIYDLSWWLNIPNLTIWQPANQIELEEVLVLALAHNGPTVIRYPKNDCPTYQNIELVEVGKAAIVDSKGKDAFLWAVGGEVEVALKVMKRLEKAGIKITVVNPRSLKPFDKKLFLEQSHLAPMITLEDHTTSGGFASLTDQVINEADHAVTCIHLGWPCETIPWGGANDIRKKYQLLPEQIAEKLLSTVFKGI
ncbi:MAG: 1-deoxy-D-xylulose-5-phosphate synthase [Lentisphaeria bacterium]|nr:1-deoxy-D-xylulose-5-phosphate synthase [Lentisphaeria bacterium]